MRSVFILLFISTYSQLFGQTRKEVDDNVFVEFPNSPKYSLQNGHGTYVTAEGDCSFFATVIRNAVPMYDRFVVESRNWPTGEKEKILGQFLDKAVESRTVNSNLKKSVEIKLVSGFPARDFSTTKINPTTGEKGFRHTLMILVNDTMISFEVWSANEDVSCNQEKLKFFNSIDITASEQN